MIPTLAIATADDARLIMCALWDAGQAFRRSGDLDSATRAYELATKAAEEMRRIEAETLCPSLAL